RVAIVTCGGGRFDHAAGRFPAMRAVIIMEPSPRGCTMSEYTLPERIKREKVQKKQILLIANGDLRLSANQNCWTAQKEMEDNLAAAVAECGHELIRAHPCKADEGHGFIGSQK